MTTHSPIALQELGGGQLFVGRPGAGKHEVLTLGAEDGIQSTIRRYPDAFLAASVIACEGASEVGLVRGIDQYRSAAGHESITAQGIALVDCGGGEADRPFGRASAFLGLGYRAAVVRDSDQVPTQAVEADFTRRGGKVVAWPDGRALEDELFLSLSDEGVGKMIDLAIDLHGQDKVNEHVKSASHNASDLYAIQRDGLSGGFTLESRKVLAAAAKSKREGWFKSVTWMEEAAREIVGPDLVKADRYFTQLVDGIFEWCLNA